MSTTSPPSSLRSVFSQNRTEELSHDVYTDFVIPPYFDELDLGTVRKPRVIQGGRGCGKTMLLLYLSHRSQFSAHKSHPLSTRRLEHIGLYWRADTQFLQRMKGHGVPSTDWSDAFEHLIALSFGIEVLDSVASIARSASPPFSQDELDGVYLDQLRPFHADLVGSPLEMRRSLQDQLYAFESWVSNAGRKALPEFLPGKQFVLALIAHLSAALPVLETATFHAYVDEYENLQHWQQRIINGYLKHSQSPLVFNIAIKRNGIGTFETNGPQALQDVADYRTYDIEELLEPHFALFAAEVLLYALRLAGFSVPLDVQMLRDPTRLGERAAPEYRERILSLARNLLPAVPEEELARIVFADSTLLRRLRRNVEAGLKFQKSEVSADAFVRSTQPAESIVASALLFRDRLSPADILEEMDKAAVGRENRFSGTSDWVHNNFIGTLLAMYAPLGRVCTFYAGFNTYCVLSRSNLRHFRELCHRALSRQAAAPFSTAPIIDPTIQAEAARETSGVFLDQVRSAGRLGNSLHTFVLRTGLFFGLANGRPSQSEPERCHFAISRGQSALSPEDKEFLDEAVKWSVLIEERATKIKEAEKTTPFDYILNPIYTPYFSISYRKRRKVELAVEDFQILSRGSYEQFRGMMRRYSKEWAVEPTEMNPSLFSHLEDPR